MEEAIDKVVTLILDVFPLSPEVFDGTLKETEASEPLGVVRSGEERNGTVWMSESNVKVDQVMNEELFLHEIRFEIEFTLAGGLVLFGSTQQQRVDVIEKRREEEVALGSYDAGVCRV